MRIIKKTITFVLVLCTALSMCACHGSKGNTAFEVPSNFDESKKIEIDFWAKNDTNKNQTFVYKKAIEDFQKLYPNVTVNLKLYTDYGKIYNDVITNMSTGTTPNVCITYPDHIATYMSGGNTVVDLDELIADEKYGLGGSELKFDGPTKEEMIPQFLQECVLADSQYGLPFMRSTEACYINKTYVEKLGYTVPDVLTWDYIWEVSEAALAKDADDNYAVNGQKVMIPFIYKSTDNMMIQMLWQMDKPYSDTDGRIELFTDTTAELLKEISVHGKSGAFSTFKISSYPANFLNAGQCIFAVDSTAGSTWMGSEAPLCDIDEDSLVDFETVVRMVPQYDPKNPKMISQGPSICLFNKEDSDEVLASWLFAQYLLTNDIQVAYSATEGYVPVTSKAWTDEAYVDYLSRGGEDNEEHYSVKIDATKMLIDNTKNTFITPVFNGSVSVRDASSYLVESVTKAVRRNKTVDDEYITSLYEDTKSLYRLEANGKSFGKTDLGPLPGESIALLVSLGVVWLGLLLHVAYSYFAKKKK